MKKIVYIMLFISLSIYSQKKIIGNLLSNGNHYLAEEDYIKAKNYYLKILELDSLNTNAYSGLGIIESRIGDKEKACSLLNKAYQLKNYEISKTIIDFCGCIKYTDLMYSKDVNEYPKFKYKKKYKLIANNEKIVNSKFTKKLEEQIKFSVILKDFKELKNNNKINGFREIDLKINIRFDKDGLFIGDVYTGDKKKRIKEITEEVTKIINKTFEIIPAKYQNKNVGTWDGFVIRIYL